MLFICSMYEVMSLQARLHMDARYRYLQAAALTQDPQARRFSGDFYLVSTEAFSEIPPVRGRAR